MPHVNDKSLLRTLAQELGIPTRLLREQSNSGRFSLDALPPGQSEFNGLLFRCFSTPRELNPWDWSVGRSFFDLQSYASWGGTTPDRFILDASAPARVAAYLLPFTRDAAEPGTRVAGVPGLRLVSATDDMILMKHLPTGGQLTVGEKAPSGIGKNWIAEHLELELDTVRDSRRTRPLFRTASMTDDELVAYADFHRPSALLSALAARIGLWWERGAYPRLRSDRRNSTVGTLSWREREGDVSVTELLNRAPLRIPDSLIVAGISAKTNPYLCLGEESMELDWHAEPRHSLCDLFGQNGRPTPRPLAVSAPRPSRRS